MMNQPYKACPRCQTPAVLEAQNCANCGHLYRTQFAPAPPQYPGQTQAFYTPQDQPPQQLQQQSMYPPPPHPVYGAPPYYQPPFVAPGWIQVPPGTHSIAAAVLLSIFCLVGAGQCYNKQWGKGIVMLVGSIFCAIFTLGFSALITWPICLIDAILIATKLNRGVAVRDWEFF